MKSSETLKSLGRMPLVHSYAVRYSSPGCLARSRITRP